VGDGPAGFAFREQTGNHLLGPKAPHFGPERSSSQFQPGRHGGRTLEPGLPPTFSHLIIPARRHILASAGKIILE
jgi:hypothetical protein